MAVAAIVVAAAGPGLAAQQPQAPRVASDVLTRLPQTASIAQTSAVVELTIRWDAASTPMSAGGARPALAGTDPAVNLLSVTGRRTVDEGPTRERDPQLSADQLVVVVEAAGAQVLGWQLVKDPRVVRAEAGPGGALTGQVVARTATGFLVDVPADAAVLRVYECQWDGQQFLLWPVAVVDAVAR
jgi:hypothetical protein